ncbi:unannotated protein [freshwater metagenome]|uniref:Unannotated protein n=1 Tax=freshwater metagenome TaxID=449393 RepID=A0A6J7J179_9ZZZZ
MRVLVEDLHSHHLQGRQDSGERHRGPDSDHLEAHAVRIVAIMRVPVQGEFGRLQPLDRQGVVDGDRRRELLLVALGEGSRVYGEERRCACLPKRCNGRLGEEVFPTQRCLCESRLEHCVIDRGHIRAGCDAHDVVEPREHRLSHERCVVDRHPAQSLAQQSLNPEPNGGRVSITRQVHDAGDESPVVIDPQVQLRLAALEQVHDG